MEAIENDFGSRPESHASIFDGADRAWPRPG